MTARCPKPRAPGRTEAQVLAQALAACRAFGLDVRRQNTGAMRNPSGRLVRFGAPGDADISGILGWVLTGGPREGERDGRCIHIELKRDSFDPAKLRGEKKEHFARQLERLRRTNDGGGVGLWTNQPETLPDVFRRLRDGCRVEIDGAGSCYLTDEPRGTDQS